MAPQKPRLRRDSRLICVERRREFWSPLPLGERVRVRGHSRSSLPSGQGGAEALRAVAPRFEPSAAASALAVLVLLVITLPLLAEGSDQFGRRHDLAGGERYTVIDFAASWCQPCYRTLPELEALAARTPGVRFLVISVDDEASGRDRLVEDLELRLPVIWDEDHGLIERFRPRGFPATYVLAPGGEVVYQHTGTSKKKWRALVDVVERLGGAGEGTRAPR